MKTFTINYPKTEVSVLGNIKTNKDSWNELEYPVKVTLLGSFVKNLVPEYEYCAVDHIPSKDKPWEQDINNKHVVLTCDEEQLIDTDPATLIFTLEIRNYIPVALVEHL